jgi:hypothetical protein
VSPPGIKHIASDLQVDLYTTTIWKVHIQEAKYKIVKKKIQLFPFKDLNLHVFYTQINNQLKELQQF